MTTAAHQRWGLDLLKTKKLILPSLLMIGSAQLSRSVFFSDLPFSPHRLSRFRSAPTLHSYIIALFFFFFFFLFLTSPFSVAHDDLSHGPIWGYSIPNCSICSIQKQTH